MTAPVVVTSVFTVAEEQIQLQLFALLTANAHDVLEHTPGFLGSTLIRCDDGRHVIHHARWRDDAALSAMLAGPGARAGMAATRALATTRIHRSDDVEEFRPS